MSTIPTSAVIVFGRRSNSDRGWGRHPNEPTSKGRVSGRSRVIAPPPRNDEPRINDRIRAREVRLIGQDGAQLGMKTLPEALSIARAAELDLVEVAGNANPPVCRIMDYGKFRYEQSRKERDSRKNQHVVELKEVRIRPKIDDHDLETKGRQAAKFLDHGDKVKLTVLFRGREMAHPDLGKALLDQLIEQLKANGTVEQTPRLEGRAMTAIMNPVRAKMSQHEKEEAQRREESKTKVENA